ncbi:MAG: helix-hairpin-helix domain-containing protein, partial [Atribacterota bacterium]
MVSLKDVTGIGAKTAERMKEAGITSIEKLANADLKELSEIKGIGKSSAKSYIEEAKKILKTMEKEEKPKEPKREK